MTVEHTMPTMNDVRTATVSSSTTPPQHIQLSRRAPPSFVLHNTRCVPSKPTGRRGEVSVEQRNPPTQNSEVAPPPTSARQLQSNPVNHQLACRTDGGTEERRLSR